MKKYYGNYLGIVIQNNDPKARGRCKIFIPHVSPTVYKNWNEVPQDKKFKFLGANIESDLNDIYEDLKKILPWSVCASPITGEMGTGRFNAFPNYGSTSDSSFSGVSGFQSDTETMQVPDDVADVSSGQQNADFIGEKEGNVYEKYRFKVNDAFSNSADNVNNVNIYSYDYTPSVYSNGPKGAFAVPSVGSHVWVFFHDGDPLFPVYFAANYGDNDWERIYGGKSGYDYPGSFENRSLSAVNESDIDYYKNKYVINQKGGTIEFVNSDYRESLKFSGYNGSFKQFALKTNVELATHNDQKLVLQDQYDTVKGFRNWYTERDLDFIVRGDYYTKIGNLKSEYFQQWHDIVASLANIKQLFETRRAEKFDVSPYFRLTSTLQNREGDFAVCPVCLGESGKPHLVVNNKKATFNVADFIAKSVNPLNFLLGKDASRSMAGVNGESNPASLVNIPQTSNCPACGGTGESPSSKDGKWDEEQAKKLSEFKKLYKSKIQQLAEIESKMGLGGSQIIDITKNKVENIGLIMNDFPNVRVDLVGKMNNSAVVLDPKGAFVTQTPSPLFEKVHVDDLPGGSYSLNVANRYNIMVGAGGLSMKSYGPVDLSGSITSIGGQQVNLSAEFDMTVQGGKRFYLEADLVTIKNRQGGQVLIDSNMGVNGNVIIKGGLHVDGELTINHVTAPSETQVTEMAGSGGELVPGLLIGTVVACPGGDAPGVPLPVFAVPTPGTVGVYSHSHQFKNIPIKLMGSNEEVRSLGKANEQPFVNPALPIENLPK